MGASWTGLRRQLRETARRLELTSRRNARLRSAAALTLVAQVPILAVATFAHRPGVYGGVGLAQPLNLADERLVFRSRETNFAGPCWLRGRVATSKLVLPPANQIHDGGCQHIAPSRKKASFALTTGLPFRRSLISPRPRLSL